MVARRSITLFNNKPADKSAFTIQIADANIFADDSEWSIKLGRVPRP